VNAVEVNAEAIPEELKERDQWLLWDRSNHTPRQPHWRGDFKGISWSDPDEWHTFDEAVEAAREKDSWGVGYVTAADNDDHSRGIYGVIDVDGGADEEDNPREWLPGLQSLVDEEGAYVEWSPSHDEDGRSGLHIPVWNIDVPDWWSNTEHPDEDHTGVDVLTNKFCTFTGDEEIAGEVLEDHAGVEEWLADAYEGLTGETAPPRENEELAEDIGGGSPDKRSRNEEWMSEERAEEALSHIDASCSYEQWRNIGFALSDEFNDRTALRLFESWSRGSSKWDDEAERLAERIVTDSEAGGGVTIGTLVYHAQRGGWEPAVSADSGGDLWKEQVVKNSDQYESADEVPDDPADLPRPGDSAESKSNPASGGGAAEEHNGKSGDGGWGYVIAQFEEEETDAARFGATQALEAMTSWMYVVESEILWVYDADRGYFNPWGEERVGSILEERLGKHKSRTDKEEIIARLRDRNQVHRKEINARTREEPLLCVGNGVVNLETGELMGHSPEYKFTRGLRWDYDPERADPEPVLEFLDGVTKRKSDRDTLLDHLGHGLMPGHPYRAFVVMYGPGSNGKTRVGKLFRGFVGEENAASVELQDLTGDDSFATGGLPGAFVNVGDDISVGEVRDTSILKSLTGDGTVRANEKYEKKYDFENEAAMFFSANEPPRFAEQTPAISDRLYPIEMPFRFVDEPAADNEKKKIPGVAEALLNDEEAMRGLLLLAVEHAQNVNDRDGEYSMPGTPEERRERYEAASDPIKRFAIDHLEAATSSDAILKDDAYTVYTEMCEIEGERAASANVFKRKITQMASIDAEDGRTRALTPGDDQPYCWRYVTFADSARDFMSDRLTERYFDDGTPAENDDDGDGGDDSPAAERSNPWNANAVAEVADDPTGYATVSVQVLDVTHADGENQPSWRATVKDETSAIDVVCWDDPGAPDEGDYIVLKNAELDEYDGKTQLVVRPNVTDRIEIQPGVAYTEGAETASGQSSIEESAAAADGGEPTSLKPDLPPEDAEGNRADARRLAWILEGSSSMSKTDIRNAAKAEFEMNLGRAGKVLDWAVEKTNLIEKVNEDADEYRVD